MRAWLWSVLCLRCWHQADAANLEWIIQNLVCLSVKLLLVSSPSACSNSFECCRWNHVPWNWRSWGLSGLLCVCVFLWFFLLVSCICGNLWLTVISISQWTLSQCIRAEDGCWFVCLLSCELSQQSLFVVLHEKVTYEKAWMHSSMNQYRWFLPLESH